MKIFTLTISIGLFLILLVGMTSPLYATSITIPLTRDSSQNKILDFYAGGSTSDGYNIRISPQGGTMSENGYLSIEWMPWSYSTEQWSTGTVYIIFLVNVTQTNFRIGFLYLTNSSLMGFILRWYDYGTNALSTWTFQGIQQIYNRTVLTSPVEMPRLQISPKAQTNSGVSALGSQLHLDASSGEWLNNTSQFEIYPVYTQFFGGATDYNEVWSLLVDNVENYYFAILYMQNSNNSRVIIEHLLRLDDYQKMPGQWVNAKWTKGQFENTLTVRSPFPNSLVKVDGFPFQTNDLGILTTGVPAGPLSVEVPQEIQDSANSRTRFLTWSKFGNSNPMSVIVNSSIGVSAEYVHEYRMSVNSEYVATNGTGWYPDGTNATFAVPKLLDFGNGTRQVFVQWEGSSNSTSPNAWVIVDSGKEITAKWKTQYALSISAPGLSANTSVNVLVGNDQIKLNGSKPYIEWVDAYQQLSIVAQNPQVAGPNGNYAFAEFRADNQTFGGVLIVTQPTSVWLMYNQIPSASPALNVASAPKQQSQGTGVGMLESMGAIVMSSNGLSLLTQSLVSNLKGVPYLSGLIGLTTTLVNLGTLLAAPHGPPIAGFFIGSMFVGFIYVFPVSALALLYRSMKTKRHPRSLKLVPLGIVWGSSLTVVILSASVNALHPFVALSEMLLVLTNTLLFPLLAAYQVARLAA